MTEPAHWRNRITGHGEEAPDQLLANPANFRIHPKAQQDHLSAVIDQVGLVQSVIVNQRTGHVVDGHLRVSLAISRGEPSIPVVYVDLSEDEERLVLATFDPISAMAGTDRELLTQLLADVLESEATVTSTLQAIAESEGIRAPMFLPVGIEEQGRLDQKAPVTCPECGHVFTT